MYYNLSMILYMLEKMLHMQLVQVLVQSVLSAGTRVSNFEPHGWWFYYERWLRSGICGLYLWCTLENRMPNIYVHKHWTNECAEEHWVQALMPHLYSILSYYAQFQVDSVINAHFAILVHACWICAHMHCGILGFHTSFISVHLSHIDITAKLASYKTVVPDKTKQEIGHLGQDKKWSQDWLVVFFNANLWWPSKNLCNGLSCTSDAQTGVHSVWNP